MRLTRRGETVLIILAMLIALVLGMTAQVWNPYTRHLDHERQQLTTCYEDGWCGSCTPGALCDDTGR